MGLKQKSRKKSPFIPHLTEGDFSAKRLDTPLNGQNRLKNLLNGGTIGLYRLRTFSLKFAGIEQVLPTHCLPPP